MKLFHYSVCFAGILLIASFIPPGKQRKVNLPMGSHVGHVQWIKVTCYQAVKDTRGAIIKGSPIFMNTITGAWTYDEYGDEIEHDKYFAYGIAPNKIFTAYYPNGDIREIKDSNEAVMSHGGNGRDANMIVKVDHYQNTDTKFYYRYDASGNLLYSAERIYYNGSTMASSCNLTEYIYDSCGKLLEEYIFKGDTTHPNASTIFQYNKMGQMTSKDESKEQNGGLVPIIKTIFKYDNKDREIGMVTHQQYPEGGLIKDKKTTYDNSGDTLEIVEKDYLGRDSSLYQSETKQFINNKIYTSLNNIGNTDYYIHYYDSAKHLLDAGRYHIRYNKDGTVDTVLTGGHITNDKHFNIIEEVLDYANGRVYWENTYQYKYDSVGNWVEKISLTNGKPDQITEREIHYFTSRH